MGREWRVRVLAGCWVGLVLCGFWRWERYDRTAGGVGRGTTHSDEVGRWQLTVFAHPHCPCSRATLRELDALARATPALATRVLFVRPPGGPGEWERGEAWDAATRIPGAEVSCDHDGISARTFGAKTSGHAVLTDPTGRVVFCGGLTRARGRTGASEGRNAVAVWVGGGVGAEAAPVFGCPLFAGDE